MGVAGGEREGQQGPIDSPCLCSVWDTGNECRAESLLVSHLYIAIESKHTHHCHSFTVVAQSELEVPQELADEPFQGRMLELELVRDIIEHRLWVFVEVRGGRRHLNEVSYGLRARKRGVGRQEGVTVGQDGKPRLLWTGTSRFMMRLPLSERVSVIFRWPNPSNPCLSLPFRPRVPTVRQQTSNPAVATNS
jgi:hypothetical protein